MSYTETLKKNNEMLDEMNKTLLKLNTTQNKTAEVLKKANDEGEKAVELAKTRSEASTKLTKLLEKENKQFNLLQLNVFETYRNFQEFEKITGQGKFVSILEYIDLLLTGTSQKMKVFGIEVATARKIMYGFLPPGMFRLFNQLSTGIRTMTGAIRAFKGEGEEANNMFSNMGKLFKKLPNPAKAFKDLGKGRRKRNLKALEKAKQDIGWVKQYRGPKDVAKLQKQIEGREAFERKSRTPFQKLRDATGSAGVKAGIMAQNVKGFAEQKGAAIMAAGGKGMTKIKEAFIFGKAYARFVWRHKDWRRVRKDFGGLIKKLNPVTAFIKLIKTPIMQALITGMFYLTMIVLVVALITKIVWPALKGAFETFVEFTGILMSGFASIWDGVKEVFTSLIEGDLLGVMNGLLEIAWGLIKVVFGLLVAVLAGIISFVVNFALVIWNKTIAFGKKLIADPVGTIKKNIGKIALIGLAVIGFFFGLPVMLAGIALFALFAIGRWIYNKIAGLFDYFAEGGVSSGGMAIVGEKGPELVNLPRGAKVHSNKDSKKMVSSGGSNTINVTVNATSTNDAELRRIAQKVAQMINREVNRTTSSSMSR